MTESGTQRDIDEVLVATVDVAIGELVVTGEPWPPEELALLFRWTTENALASITLRKSSPVEPSFASKDMKCDITFLMVASTNGYISRHC